MSPRGVWTGWIRFFLEVVRDACRAAIDLVGRLAPLPGSAQPTRFVARDIVRLLNEGRAMAAAPREDVAGSQPELPF
ncbi:MAG: hypothetical protein NZ555_15490 [Geminicoccaceae bacterium]|nr:hypothetical protein [Geminicoccaceae bacterium]MCX8101783.1 hypothetical protein [Geminicoccaceae bacterium]MDW8369978.1 hypothetical protein [Geminicoccaceae bacterium]